MSMIVWKVDFEYMIEDAVEWMPSTACHLGDENGGLAVNYVRDKMVGSEVEIKAVSGVEAVVKNITDFRLIGLAPIAKLNTIDIQVLVDCKVIEPVGEETKLTVCGKEQNVKPCHGLDSPSQEIHNPFQPCDHCGSQEGVGVSPTESGQSTEGATTVGGSAG